MDDVERVNDVFNDGIWKGVLCEFEGGHFWAFYICTVGTTMPLPFQTIVWGVLNYVIWLMRLGIVLITIVVFVPGW